MKEITTNKKGSTTEVVDTDLSLHWKTGQLFSSFRTFDSLDQWPWSLESSHAIARLWPGTMDNTRPDQHLENGLETSWSPDRLFGCRTGGRYRSNVWDMVRHRYMCSTWKGIESPLSVFWRFPFVSRFGFRRLTRWLIERFGARPVFWLSFAVPGR